MLKVAESKIRQRMDNNDEDIAAQETENDETADDDDKDATGADKGDEEDQGDPGPPDSVAVQASIDLDQLTLLRRRPAYGNSFSMYSSIVLS